MKLRILLYAFLINSALFADAPAEKPAPVVNIVFENSSGKLESVLSLANIGNYLGAANTAVYRPQFLPHNGQIKQDSVVFDPEVYSRGVAFYPFMFTYKGDFYYVFFSNVKEESKVPFFATVIKIINVDEKTKSSKIETITNIDFSQNDRIVILLDKDELKFYNYTTKTRFNPISKESKQVIPGQPTAQKPQATVPPTKATPKAGSIPRPSRVGPARRVSPPSRSR